MHEIAAGLSSSTVYFSWLKSNGSMKDIFADKSKGIAWDVIFPFGRRLQIKREYELHSTKKGA